MATTGRFATAALARSVSTSAAYSRTSALAASAARWSSSLPARLRAASRERKSSAKARFAWLNTRTPVAPLATVKSTTTPSMPSSEVPDMRPMKSELIVWTRAAGRSSGRCPVETAPTQAPATDYSPNSGARGSVSATPSWTRTLSASCPKRAFDAGATTAASELRATSSGSCCMPSILTSKCR